MAECNITLQREQKPYPRTCAECGLFGSCRYFTKAIPIKLFKDIDRCFEVLMPGIGKLAVAADDIRLLNETMIEISRLKKPPGKTK